MSSLGVLTLYSLHSCVLHLFVYFWFRGSLTQFLCYLLGLLVIWQEIHSAFWKCNRATHIVVFSPLCDMCTCKLCSRGYFVEATANILTLAKLSQTGVRFSSWCSFLHSRHLSSWNKNRCNLSRTKNSISLPSSGWKKKEENPRARNQREQMLTD
jgi:hypothetical protein